MNKFYCCLILLIYCRVCDGQCSVKIDSSGSLSFCNGNAVTLMASASGGGMQVDQSQLIYNGGTSARNLPGYSYWQSFTAGVTGTLTRIDVGFFNYINGTIYFTVFKGSGTTGQLLDSLELPVICPVNMDTLMPFFVNIPITAGNVYTFQVRPATNIPDPYGLQVNVSNGYAAGQMAFVDPSGTYYPGFDMVFKTYIGTSLFYHWSTGSTDSSIVVTTGGKYYITVTDSAGCIAMDSALVTVKPTPPVPFIQQFHDTLFCMINGGYTSYQWYADTTLLSGATDSFLVITHGGNYNLNVTNSYGCAIAAGINVGLPFYNDKPRITIASNPASAQLLVSVNRISGGQMIIRIYNVAGRLITTVFTRSQTTSVQVNDLAPGLYILDISSGSERTFCRFVKE